jgi:Holliday junction resolvasome RuvABC DNA-binding subunit
MTGHGEKLSRNKEKAISALISSSSIAEAAKIVGIGEKTLWRWLKLNGFKKAYREARRTIVNQAIAKVQLGMSAAIKTLMCVMIDEKAPASARVSAAKAMIDIGFKASEIEDLESRIENLEMQLSGGHKL